jgi:hypothetical protein
MAYGKLHQARSEPQNRSLRRTQAEWNIEFRMSKDGIASLSLYNIDRSTKGSRQAEYIIRRSMLISFSFHLTGRSSDQRQCSYPKLKSPILELVDF